MAVQAALFLYKRGEYMRIISSILLMLMLATQQLDKPYSYSAAGPDAYDCSGLVYFCYKQIFDIELPHSAKQIGYGSEYGTVVDRARLRKGDVLCFDTNRGDSDLSDHVGIYLGDNEFIHASSGQGRVIISPLDEGFYNECFSWGKRIIQEE